LTEVPAQLNQKLEKAMPPIVAAKYRSKIGAQSIFTDLNLTHLIVADAGFIFSSGTTVSVQLNMRLVTHKRTRYLNRVF